MQRAHSTVDIDGHQVHTGSTVQVKWLGVWYEGFVVEMGPKRNLCRIRDTQSQETVLVESKRLQLKETQMTDRSVMTTGTHVVYHNKDCRLEGVVESRSAVGVILVSWRKSGLSEENLTWFELPHIAPVIHNELFMEHNRDRLEAGRSGLLHNNAIEPRPRTMDNLLYESGSDKEAVIHTELAAASKKSHKHSQQRTEKDTEDFYVEEEVADRKRPTESAPFLLSPHHYPMPSYLLPPPPVFMAFPPMIPHLQMIPHPPIMPHSPPPPSKGNTFPHHPNQNPYIKPSSSFTSTPGGQQQSLTPPPHSPLWPGVIQTSSAYTLSYTTSANGIPPHPSSRFFQSLRDGGSLWKGKSSHAQAKSREGRSPPTVNSRAISEPTHDTTITDLVEPTKVSNQNRTPEKTLPLSFQQTSTPSHTSQHPDTVSESRQEMTKSPLGKEGVSRGGPPPLPPSRPLPPHSRSVTNSSWQPPQPTSGREPSPDRGMSQRSPGGYVGEEERSAVNQEGVEEVEGHSQKFTSDKVGLEIVSASPGYVTVSHGGSTLLTCVAQGPQSVHYHWLRDGNPISEQDPFFTQPAPGMLQIQMASLYLTGEYKCIASDGHSSLERVFHLEVCSEPPVSEIEVERVESHFPPEYEVVIAETDRAKVNSTPYPEPPIIAVEHPQQLDYPTHHLATSPAVAPPPPLSGRDTPDIQGSSGKIMNETRDTAKGGREVRREAESEVSKQQGATDGKRSKRNKWRVSSALKNDMEQYLEGYGENYGALSSQSAGPELTRQEPSEGEGTRRRKKKRHKEKKRKKEANSFSQGSSPKKLVSGSLKKSPRGSRSLGKLTSSLLRRSRRKEKVDDTERTPPQTLTPAWQTVAPPNSPSAPLLLNNPAENVTQWDDTGTNQGVAQWEYPPPNPTRAVHDKEETNSVVVHTSVDGASLGSEVGLKGEERERLELPQEPESLHDSVRRLQLSVQEHCPEQVKLEEMKKGFLSNSFPRNRSS